MTVVVLATYAVVVTSVSRLLPESWPVGGGRGDARRGGGGPAGAAVGARAGGSPVRPGAGSTRSSRWRRSPARMAASVDAGRCGRGPAGGRAADARAAAPSGCGSRALDEPPGTHGPGGVAGPALGALDLVLIVISLLLHVGQRRGSGLVRRLAVGYGASRSSVWSPGPSASCSPADARHPIGWMLLAVSGLFLFAGPGRGGGVRARSRRSRAPGPVAARVRPGRRPVLDRLPALGILFIHVLLRFPDGRLPSPRWRWFSRTTIGLLAAGVVVIAMGGADVVPGSPTPRASRGCEQREWLLGLVALPLLASLPIAVASLVVRYRRADALQRIQIRWFAWAAGLATGLYLVSFLAAADEWHPGMIMAVIVFSLVPRRSGWRSCGTACSRSTASSPGRCRTWR